MKRLLESTDAGDVAERAREVLAALQPLPECELRKRRIRSAIERTPARARRASRAPLLVAAIVFTVGAAAAGVGPLRSWVAQSPAASDGPASAAAADTTGPQRGAALHQPLRSAPSSPELEVTPPDVGEAAAQPEKTSSGVRAAPARVGRAPASSAGAVSQSDVDRIHEAARALRGEGDAERAARLLSTVPGGGSGPLAEETLALRIEAAVARRDPSAAALAREYLARYPSGRYRAAAHHALKRTP